MIGHHSIRLPQYDYASPGIYFVTICTSDRRPVFSRICDGIMTLSEEGALVYSTWKDIPRKFPNTELDSFVIMPDHIHGIIGIKSTDRTIHTKDQMRPYFSSAIVHTSAKGTSPHSLSAIIQYFKSSSTRQLNRRYHSTGKTIWQRGFYERVVRNNRELSAIRNYIINNPARWEEHRS